MTHANVCRAWTVTLVLIAAPLVPCSSVSAQKSVNRSNGAAGWGAIDGSVRDTSGSWLRGVEVVSVDNSLISTRTGAGGSFRIDSMSTGPHLIRFRRIGVLPLTVSVVIHPNDVTSVDAVVEPFPITLARVTVQAASGELVHLPPGVADRMRTGIGTYITADQIAKEHTINTIDVFRRVAGVAVSGLPGKQVVSTTRGVQTFNGDPCATGMAVVLDGVPLDATVSSTRGALPVPADSRATGGLDTISPKDIAAIEIYKDAAETPASLIASSCGVIYVWTR